MLRKEDIKMIYDMSWDKAFNQTGIAGMSDFQQVKCLHTHYAHYKARPDHENVIGSWVEELLQEYFPNYKVEEESSESIYDAVLESSLF